MEFQTPAGSGRSRSSSTATANHSNAANILAVPLLKNRLVHVGGLPSLSSGCSCQFCDDQNKQGWTARTPTGMRTTFQRSSMRRAGSGTGISEIQFGSRLGGSTNSPASPIWVTRYQGTVSQTTGSTHPAKMIMTSTSMQPTPIGFPHFVRRFSGSVSLILSSPLKPAR